MVIQAATEIVGFNYVLAPGARGRKVTVQTMGKISSDEVFGVLLTILDVNGLAAVRSGNLYRIIPREGAPQTSVKTIVGRDVDPAHAARRDRHADRAAASSSNAHGRGDAAPAVRPRAGHHRRPPRDEPADRHRHRGEHPPAARHRAARRRGGGPQRAPDHPAQVRRRPGDGPAPDAALRQRPPGRAPGRAPACPPGPPPPPPDARAPPAAPRPPPAGAASSTGSERAADRARAPLELARGPCAQSRTWRPSAG